MNQRTGDVDPQIAYQSRRDAWAGKKELADSRFRSLGNWRLAIVIGSLALAYSVWTTALLPFWTLAIPVIAFVVLAARGSSVARQQKLAARALSYYDSCLRRIEDRWMGDGLRGDRFRDSHHLYADDLDLFGEGSLFQMVAQARTAAGEETLASWLLAPAAREEAMARQAAIQELRNRLDLREALATLGPDLQSETDVAALERWASRSATYFPRWLKPVALALAVASVGAVIGFFGQVVPLPVLAIVVAADLLLARALRKRVSDVLTGGEELGGGLKVLALVLATFEDETFTSAKLTNLHRQLSAGSGTASRHIQRLNRITDWLDSGDHILVRALSPLVVFREQVAISLERWRRRSGPSMSAWLKAIGEFEALCSLAALSYERPEWHFPTFAEEQGTFCAVQLQHPLLPRNRSVPNDVQFAAPLQLLVVSGSNMSGKSTLLRAAGLNAVLAWAGSPVAASKLKLSHLQTAASIRVTDSLQDSRSRFFAEITRLKQIVALSKEGKSIFFLFDELLSGTNSHDRLIGASAIARTLVESSAIGFITTHDLALTDIVQQSGASAANFYFEDKLGGGGMDFDYKLREGMVTHSNALELMRAVGLEI